MKYGTKDINWGEVGAMLANEGDVEQAEFLTSFCKELRKACATHFHLETQLICVQKRLPKDDQELLAVCCTNEVN